MTLLDDLERLHAEASAGGVAPLTAWRNGAAKELLSDAMLANAPRLLAMLRAAEGMRGALKSILDFNEGCGIGGLCDADGGAPGESMPYQTEPMTGAITTAIGALAAYDAAKGE